MSKRYPIIAVTGSSGAGTTTVKVAFEHIFYRLQVNAAFIEGDSFHRYNRAEMREVVAKGQGEGRPLSHLGAEANLFEELEELFRQYSQTGTGQRRYYPHNWEEAEPFGQEPGTFTPWEDLPKDTDLLFYEGLHGAVVTEKVNGDTAQRGYTPEDVTETILRRMPDYVRYIIPQFSLTDINFQRVPTVDTSNPFIARDIPTPDESFAVIRFRDPGKFHINFPYILAILRDSFMSRRNSIVVPGGKMGLAMEIILEPIIKKIMEERQALLGTESHGRRPGGRA